MTQEISVMVADSEPIITGMAMLVAKVSVACIAPAGMIARATRKRCRGDRSAPSAVVVVVLIASRPDGPARLAASRSPGGEPMPAALSWKADEPNA